MPDHRWDRRSVPAALLLLALWLLTHPWEGLWHDSRLYALQALHRLTPQQFQGDLFFLHGSQDAFTVFSPLYASAIQAFGLDGAALLLQSLGSLLWVGAAAFLLAAFLRGLPFWLGLALLIALPADYGPTITTFNVGEAFPTPRLFAEALGLLAMGCAVRGRWAWGVPALLLAVLLHPLMAAGVALFGLLYLAEGRRRMALTALLLAVGGASVAGAAVLGIAPFDRLLHSVDQAWLAQLLEMTPIVSWDGWRLGEWGSRCALAFSLTLAAACLLQGARARFFRCAALAGALGVLATWIGTGLLHNQLLMQLQPWRALWLVQVASALALACLWRQYWQRGRLWRVLLLAFCVAILTRNTFGGALAGVAAALLVVQARRPQPVELTPRHYRLCLVLLAVLASALLREIVGGPAWTGIFVNDIPYATADTLWLWICLKRGLAALLGVGLLLLAWRLAGSGQRQGAGGAYAAACILGLACVAGSAALALARADAAQWTADESAQAVRAGFLPLIPPHAVVYWENDVRNTWFVLQRASYASYTQMAGAVFNRGTALEGARRMARLQRLGAGDSVRKRSRIDTAMAISLLPPPSRAGLAFVCADPALDFVVMHQDYGGVVASVAHQGERLYLHDCRLLRAAPARA